MITKHEDPNGNEYLSKLLDNGQFLVLQYDGKTKTFTKEDFYKYVNNRKLSVTDFIKE